MKFPKWFKKEDIDLTKKILKVTPIPEMAIANEHGVFLVWKVEGKYVRYIYRFCGNHSDEIRIDRVEDPEQLNLTTPAIYPTHHTQESIAELVVNELNRSEV